jgi:HTH-type transcriptional regulator/antitoxin HigA
MITTEEEYKVALKDLSVYFDNPPETGSPEFNRFGALFNLVYDYEEVHYPIEEARC